jgi:hypothetical protein
MNPFKFDLSSFKDDKKDEKWVLKVKTLNFEKSKNYLEQF